MLTFILDIVILASFAFILYLFSRALPRVSDADASDESPAVHWFVTQLEHADEVLLALLEKWLRRVRVIVLKLDNTVTKKLHRFQKGNGKESTFSLEEEKENIPSGNGQTESPQE